MNSYKLLLLSDCFINNEYYKAALFFRKNEIQITDKELNKIKIKNINLFKYNKITLKTIQFKILIKKLIPFQVKNVCNFDKSPNLSNVSVLSLVSK